MSNIPIIGQTQEQPAFPRAVMNFLPDGSGVMLVVQLGPSTSINHLFDAASMDGICKQWQEIKRQSAMIMQAVQNSRNV